MKMKLDYVSISGDDDDDYFQVCFDEKKPSGKEADMDGQYLIIQKEYEGPDDGKIYVETHDLSHIGHFKVAAAKLNSRGFSLALQGKAPVFIEVDFRISVRKYRQLGRVMKIMIPKIEITDRDQIC